MISQIVREANSGVEVRTEADRVLCLALDIGEGLLKSGDSVHHVEDTVHLICRAYGGEHIETFAIYSLILASVRMKDGSYSSQIRRIYSNANQMAMLESFNALSRRICLETPDFETAQKMLKDVKAKKSSLHWLWLSLGGHCLVAASFAVMFGGSLRDGLAGILVGLVLGLLSHFTLGTINALAKTLLLSFIAGVTSYATVTLGIGQNVDTIIIGSIMLLIPGVALGNALRDLLCGDILTGMLKTVQSCITAIFIACGYSFSVWAMTGFSVQSGIPAIEHTFPVRLLTAILGTAAFAAVFGVRPSLHWIASLCGGAVYAVYCLSDCLGAHAFVASFCCAVFGAVMAEILARVCRVPAIIFVTMGIIPIVPGSSLYYTMSALLSRNYPLLFAKAEQTLFISAGLVVGSMLVTVVISILRERRMRRESQR